LGRFGAHARSAVPGLVWILNDTNLDVRLTVTNALRDIAPEVLTNGVVKMHGAEKRD
jgi:hypothetical protein